MNDIFYACVISFFSWHFYVFICELFQSQVSAKSSQYIYWKKKCMCKWVCAVQIHVVHGQLYNPWNGKLHHSMTFWEKNLFICKIQPFWMQDYLPDKKLSGYQDFVNLVTAKKRNHVFFFRHFVEPKESYMKKCTQPFNHWRLAKIKHLIYYSGQLHFFFHFLSAESGLERTE